MSRKNVQHIKLKGSNPNPKQTFVHENFVAGITPNLRGYYSTMYVINHWKTIKYVGFSTTEESNALYRKNLETRQEGLCVSLDLTTHRSYNSDYECEQRGVEKADIAINSVEDMKILFNQIPLDKIAVSITINKALLPILAFYIVAAEEQGVSSKNLKGTIQNDILEELMVCNTYTYPPTPSIKVIADIFKYTSNKMPKFNSISISGYHIQEAGATTEIELAYTLTAGLEYIKKGIEAGIDIDTLAPRLSFFWAIGMNHFTEIAKLRAGRMLWAKIVKKFNPKNEKSLALRTHCQTSGWSLTEQDPFNNVARATIKSMAAAFGGTQSLHTNTLDESIALPTDFSARIARNTQIYLQEETYITKTVDPWAGSYHLENLTKNIANKTWELINEVKELGGMTKAIEKGIPKMRIEEAAAKKQAKINNRQDIIVRVHKNQLKQEKPLPILDTDNKAVRKYQVERLEKLKSERNSTEVKKSLIALTEATKTGKENLLDLTIKAAKNRATLREISDALEEAF